MGDFSSAAPRTLWKAGGLAFLPASLLLPVWNRIFAGHPGSSAAAAVLAWLWITEVFVSAAVLWQGRESRLFGTTSFIVGLSGLLSGFWLLVFYPAVMSFDALGQWRQALADRYSTWSPPLLPMLMHFTQHFVKGPSLLSFLQGLLFWGALLFLIHRVAGSHRAFLVHSTIVVCLPPLWLYSNAATSTTWGAAFLMLAIGFLIQAVKGPKILLFYLSVLCISAAGMFREESLLCVIVPLAVYVFHLGKKSGLAKKAATVVIMAVLAVAPGRLIELSPRVTRAAESRVHGLFTQYVGTIVHSLRRMTPGEIDRERQDIDREFGKGVFEKLMERYDCSSGDYIIYNRDHPRVMRGIPREKNFFVLKKVIQAALRHPFGYLRHQACYFGYLVQFSELGYQSWGVLKEDPQIEAGRARLGIAYDTKLPSLKAYYGRLMNAILGSPVLSLIVRHYVFLFLSALILGVGFALRKTEWLIPSLFSFVYVSAYLLAGPAELWRYLFLPYLAAWACLPGFVSSAYRTIRVRAPREKGK